MAAHKELAVLLGRISELSKQARILISVCNQNASKKDHDLLAKVFDDLLDAEISAARYLKGI